MPPKNLRWATIYSVAWRRGKIAMLLLAIAVAAFACTLAGGLLALGLGDKLHLILGFSAGAVIGVAFFDLLPEAIDTARNFQSAATILAWSALGFLLYLVLDRMLLIHGDAPPRAYAGALVLCAHSLLDGVAIGFAFQGSRAVGLVVAAAVLTHDFSDGVNTMNIVLRNGGARARGRGVCAGCFPPRPRRPPASPRPGCGRCRTIASASLWRYSAAFSFTS